MDFQSRSRSEFVPRIEMTAWVLNNTDAGGETKMRSKTLVPLFLLIAPWMVAQSNAPAASGQDSEESTLTLKQEVRNVVIDVVVTDKHGQPVKSLQKPSFQVLENGMPQDILFFEEHGLDGLATKLAPEPKLPPDTFTNVTTAPNSGPLMVLLLDAINTRPDQQSYVHAQMNEYLKNIPPGTRMAIFTLGDRLQLIQGFTSDPAILKAALSGKSYPASTTLSPGNLFSTGNSNVMSVRSSLQRFGNGPTTLGDDLRVRYTMDALNAVAAYLSDIPGRKSLIWFAGSVPWMINPDFSLVTDATGRVDYSDQLKQLADVMALGRIAIYPVDAHGLSTPPMYSPSDSQTAGSGSPGMDASSAGPGFHSPGGGFTTDNAVSSGSAFGAREMGSQMNIAGNHMSMSNLAAATGGRALYNTNGLAGAVSKVQAIGNSYYSLAYSPKDKRYDGNLRKVEVKVSAPGVKLEYRRGYYADDPARTASRSRITYSSNSLRTVMKRGAPDSTEIPFRVQVRAAAEQPTRPADRIGNAATALKGPVIRFDFHWEVDLTGIEFTPSANGMRRAEVDAALDAYDADGNILNTIYAVLPLNFSDVQYQRLLKSGLRMKQSLDVPEGLVYLRAGVIDPNSGHTGATEFPLDVKPSL
jgi:VWFA-related protein